MSGRTVTLTVPSVLYEHLQQRAEQRQHSIEDEVVLTLAATIPDSDLPPADLEATLATFTGLDDDTLWQLARSRVAEEDSARLDELGDQRQRAGLTRDELREAEELVQQHDRVMVVRAEAAAVLKQRGHDVSTLHAEA